MDKQAFIDRAYSSAFQDELEKIANDFSDGVKSYAAGLVPSAAISVPISIYASKRRPSLFAKEHKSENLSKLKKAMNISDDVKVFKNDQLASAGGGGAFHPITKQIGYIANPKSTEFQRAILSHELGHSKNYRKFSKPLIAARMAGTYGASIGSLGAAFSNSDESSRNYGIAGSALGGTVLAEESLATARGIRGLQKFHGGGSKGLSKALFKGKAGGARMVAMNIGSYGSLAAAPYLTYKIKQHLKKDK